MCAIEAGKRGRRVAVIEHSDRCGKKILISGGGRCNFTNLHCRPENFISANPHFAKSALARYTPADFIALVEKHGIRYHEKTLGQLFCDGSSREILQNAGNRMQGREGRNLREHQRSGSHQNHRVRASNRAYGVPFAGAGGGDGRPVHPQDGRDCFGYDLARQFGIKLQEPRPALVSLLLAPEDRSHYSDLAGVSAEVIASCDGARVQREDARHASWVEWSCHPADFFLLEAACVGAHRPGA